MAHNRAGQAMRVYSRQETTMLTNEMTVAERIRKALLASQPASALRVLVKELAGEGRGKADIVGALEAFVVHERQHPEFAEAQEDIVLDVLDGLQGSCHPAARLDVG
jgi:hypothetical protein